jgi:hypothetical protein
MHARRSRALASQRLIAPSCGVAVAAMLLTAAVAGCGSSPGKSQSTAAVSCGTTKTAANVPVHIQVVRGQVACATALQVERDYASEIESGQVPGTGGGAPVRVQGWTCQGFTTPVVLKTGDASKCVKGSTEILAVLPSPT